MKVKDRLAIEPEFGEALRGLVIENKPDTIVEIGTGSGYSTSFLLRGVNEVDNGTIYTFDNVERKPYYWKEEGISDKRLKKFNVSFEYGIKDVPKTVDFVFHDAGHFFEHVYTDLMLLIPRMKHGLVAIHDIVYSNDMGEKVKAWFETMGWEYKENRYGCGMGVAVK